MRSGRSTWVALTALAALVLLVGAWFTLLSPRLARISELNEEQEAAEQRSSLLSAQIARVAADHERLDELRAELAGLRTQFPTAVELPEFTRGLARLADASGARVRALTVGSSVQVSATPELPAAPDGTAAPALPQPPAGLYAVPITLTVEGTFEQAQLYASALQSATDRLFLLSRLSWASADADGSSSFSINGHTYVLVLDAAGAEAA